MLQDRFGDHQLLISTHMSKLLPLKPVNSISELKYLRKLLDKGETQVCSLEYLGLDSKNYSSLLVLVLMNKLPDELKIIMSRQFGKNVWKIGPVLRVFRNQIEARGTAYIET